MEKHEFERYPEADIMAVGRLIGICRHPYCGLPASDPIHQPIQAEEERAAPNPEPHAFKSILPKPNSPCDICGVIGSIHAPNPEPQETESPKPWGVAEEQAFQDSLVSEPPTPKATMRDEGAKDQAAEIAVMHIGHDEECPDCGRAEDAYLIHFPCSPPTAACTCDGEPLATAIRSALAAAQQRIAELEKEREKVFDIGVRDFAALESQVSQLKTENSELRGLLKEELADPDAHTYGCSTVQEGEACDCSLGTLRARIRAALHEEK